jgi:membrane protein implicated in regulation of membrane protease activity
VGYWRTVFAIASPFLISMLAVVMFTRWYTALVMVGILGAVSVYAIRKHDRHERPDHYDDRRW